MRGEWQNEGRLVKAHALHGDRFKQARKEEVRAPRTPQGDAQIGSSEG